MPDLEALELAAAAAEVCGHDLDLEGSVIEARTAFGLRQGLDYPYAFAQVTTFLQRQGRLPDCYMTKSEARDLGWKSSGRTIDDIDPDGAVGGDTFGNREGLPSRPANSYAVADLDYVEGYREAPRGSSTTAAAPAKGDLGHGQSLRQLHRYSRWPNDTRCIALADALTRVAKSAKKVSAAGSVNAALDFLCRRWLTFRLHAPLELL